MEFLKNTDLDLNPAGYLVSKTSKKPVKHVDFIEQQKKAEYVVKLADAIKGKTFKAGKLDDLEAIKKEVRDAIGKTAQNKYVDDPSKPKSDVKDQLVKYALDFVQYSEDKSKADKVNEFMNQFNSINDVEQVGEYFDEGLVKLSKIYTISEILAAVQSNIEVLG